MNPSTLVPVVLTAADAETVLRQLRGAYIYAARRFVQAGVVTLDKVLISPEDLRIL